VYYCIVPSFIVDSFLILNSESVFTTASYVSNQNGGYYPWSVQTKDYK